MNTRIYNRAIEVSKALKPAIQSGKSFHVSMAIRKSRIVCIATNDYKKPHNEKRFGKYENWKGFKSEYRACQHAEARLIAKLGEEDMSDYEILNIRINNHQEPSMARPCPNCQRVLAGFTPRRVFYSNESGELQQDERF